MEKLILMMVLLLSGCANFDYQFGDFSQVYCNSVSEPFRAQLKAELNERGIAVGVDYCAVHGLVDVVIN